MNSVVLGKRTRSRDASTYNHRIKRQARTRKIDDKDQIFFSLEEPCFDEKAETCILSNRQSRPISTCSTPVKQTPRTRATRFATRDKNTNLDEHEDPLYEENPLLTQTPTPQTPRKRDALPKKEPATPKHRVTIVGQPITPRSSRVSLTPGGSIITVYSKARHIFTGCSEPGLLIGRDDERKKLLKFILNCLSGNSGGCIYISGPPGTGKSALVTEVIGGVKVSKKVYKSCINCMSIITSKNIYGHLLEAFCDNIVIHEGQEVNTLTSIFVPQKHVNKSYIVVLDEIDHILTLDLDILYKLFEWALQKNSRLILIGIANSLDLTDRLFPLKSRNLKPQLLPFLPYTAVQIKTVIEYRLKSLLSKEDSPQNYIPFIHPAAIELCSRKVSSQNGDIRKAFEICRQAINLIESETKLSHERALTKKCTLESPSKGTSIENLNFSSLFSFKNNLIQSLATLTVETAPRASISHVNKITSSIFGNGSIQRLKVLNLQQKAILCTLLAFEKRRDNAADRIVTPSKVKNVAPTVKALHEVYCVLCKRDNVLHPLTITEFKDVIGSLETLSMVSVIDGGNCSFMATSAKRERKANFGTSTRTNYENRVASSVTEKEVAQVMEGLGGGILRNILSGEGLE